MKKNHLNLKRKIALLALVGLLTVMVSFKATISKEVKQSSQDKTITEQFIANLKTGKSLTSFFADDWTVIYHEDNRCTGSTDGQLKGLKSKTINKKIKLNVKNDGQGWACEKNQPKSYAFNFDLKELTKNWDRFEIPNYKNLEKGTVYILGSGESDFLTLFYNDKNLIIKLKYSSEDPG